MNQPTASERLTVVLRATQYLGNLTLRQDPWAELAETLERFFPCELVLIVRPGQDGTLRLVHEFTRGIPAGEVLRLAAGEVRAVLETGFMGTQTLADPACSLAFLPLPRDRRITAVAIVGHGGCEPFSKEDLEILLTLGSLFGNVVARVETEAELRDQQQTLEKLVAQRTAELEKTNARLLRESAERRQAEGELRDSEAALKAADRRKNEFLAILSHELRNPLAAIDNGMYILDHGTPGSEQACRAQAVIGRQVRQLSRLVDDLLDITRISRNKIQLRSESMNLAQLVQRSVEDQRDSFEAKEVRLSFTAPEGPVWIWADPARVTQMMDNLIINAGKFTDPGGRVDVEVLVQGPDRAGVAVTDTGMGMDAEMLGRLFRPFEQADRSLDRTRGGLGLGLAVAKGLAELHGGAVTASSPGLGKGSRFVLTLPAAPGLEPAAVAPAPPRRPAPPDPGHRRQPGRRPDPEAAPGAVRPPGGHGAQRPHRPGQGQAAAAGGGLLRHRSPGHRWLRRGPGPARGSGRRVPVPGGDDRLRPGGGQAARPGSRL
jgi:signal transduction histidine kinase